MLENFLTMLRSWGWVIGSHNEYYVHRPEGPPLIRSYWMFTHPVGYFVEGDGATDIEAIREGIDLIHMRQELNAKKGATELQPRRSAVQ